jgi:hypothetical protein
MRRPEDSFAAAVRAFKEMTAAGDQAAATRARVLGSAGQAGGGHPGPRRVALATVAGLLVVGTASVAGTTLARRWRAPAPIALVDSVQPVGLRARDGEPVVVIPHVSAALPAVADAPAAGPSDAEAAAYGRAHRAHFEGGDPARALADWDDYLRLYPAGTFAPEARFNRAICLVRLGRVGDAERGLRPFSEGRFGGYRRADADRLLVWLRERPTAP